MGGFLQRRCTLANANMRHAMLTSKQALRSDVFIVNGWCDLRNVHGEARMSTIFFMDRKSRLSDFWPHMATSFSVVGLLYLLIQSRC